MLFVFVLLKILQKRNVCNYANDIANTVVLVIVIPALALAEVHCVYRLTIPKSKLCTYMSLDHSLDYSLSSLQERNIVTGQVQSKTIRYLPC